MVNFKLSASPAYFIPEPGTLGSFRDYVLTLPATDRYLLYAWMLQQGTTGQYSKQGVRAILHVAGTFCRHDTGNGKHALQVSAHVVALPGYHRVLPVLRGLCVCPYTTVSA